ncbi:arginine/serine-rich coiled-coil protein 2 isoform X2 [Scaptodrosophila lebanonensis]|uniref:Arginine/serine-rich coiled-coil protein 2 isoform X2 n=1 Tax=Drosophila lebanonensis TaxID=7225 RepID=A0A6J2TV10_DROLE|nr:arginine/serine-rich coiled-coil protein 2 isoform X2 [Scaptodrosophila lebanonensis]
MVGTKRERRARRTNDAGRGRKQRESGREDREREREREKRDGDKNRDYSKSDRHHRTKESSDYKREREEREERKHGHSHSSSKAPPRHHKDKDSGGSNSHTRYSDTSSHARPSHSSYKSQSSHHGHHRRRSYEEQRSYERRRRQSRSPRSHSRTPTGTPPSRNRHSATHQRNYRRRDSRDSSSRSRSPSERQHKSTSASFQSASNADNLPRPALLSKPAPSLSVASAADGLIATTAMATAVAAGSVGNGGGGGGLLPTPNFAPKIPSLMSLELTDMMVGRCKQPAAPNVGLGGGVATLGVNIGATNPTNVSIQLPSYYNPGIINVNRYAEQQQKRKLLWGSKKTDDSANKWNHAHFSQDSDGKVASKFMRLMGIKNAGSNNTNNSTSASNETEVPAATDKIESSVSGGGAGGSGGSNGSVPADVKLRERMFSTMEQQYEVARAATHTMRGVGLGFGTQPRTF